MSEIPIQTNQIKQCDFCKRNSLETRVHYSPSAQMYLCGKHYQQFNRFGKLLTKTRRDKNEIKIYDTYAEIIIQDANLNECCRAIIDKEDVEKCMQHRWFKDSCGYIATRICEKQTRKIALHRFILGYCGNDEIDHINRNKLDNRKQNLRIVNHIDNMNNNDHCNIQRRQNRWLVIITRFGYKISKSYYDYEQAESFVKNIREKTKEELIAEGYVKANASRKHKTEHKGITKELSGKYSVRVYIHGRHNIGTYETIEKAIIARDNFIKNFRKAEIAS